MHEDLILSSGVLYTLIGGSGRLFEGAPDFMWYMMTEDSISQRYSTGYRIKTVVWVKDYKVVRVAS